MCHSDNCNNAPYRSNIPSPVIVKTSSSPHFPFLSLIVFINVFIGSRFSLNFFIFFVFFFFCFVLNFYIFLVKIMFQKIFIFSIFVYILFCHITNIECENKWLDPDRIQHDNNYEFSNYDSDNFFPESKPPAVKNIPPMRANFSNLCKEVVFVGNTLKVVEYAMPKCKMGMPELSIGHRNKREAIVRDLPFHFQIPAESEKQYIKKNSYIQMDFHVCGDPGAEVRVYDKNTAKVIFGFVNNGGSYHCNKIQIKELKGEKGVSESDEIQVEYTLPRSDYVVSNVDYEFLNGQTNSQGKRTVTFSDLKSKEILIFEMIYWELPFLYEEPEYLTDPSKSPSLRYDPNMVKTYIIPKKIDCNGRDCKKVGIEIIIEELNLDFNKGDYILVGPGSKPHFWLSTPSLIIARRINDNEPKKIWVHADSAFLM